MQLDGGDGCGDICLNNDQKNFLNVHLGIPSNFFLISFFVRSSYERWNMLHCKKSGPIYLL